MSENKNKNLVFVINELSKVLDDAEKGSTAQTSIISAIKEKCSTADASTSTSALHVLTKLVEMGSLSMPKGLAILISMLSSKESIPSIVPSVCRLLLLDASQSGWECPYNLSDRPHPLITILKHDWSSWDEVSAFMHNTFFGEINCEKSCVILKPILGFVLADPSAPMLAKTEIIQSLITKNEDKLLIELLAWQQIDINWCILIRQIAQNGLSNNNLRDILAPALAVSCQFLIKHGKDPSLWLFYLEKCVDEKNSDLVLNILVQILPNCPSVYLIPVVKFCSKIIGNKDCNLWTGNAIAAAILTWAISPTILTRHLTDSLKEILKTLPELRPAKNSPETVNPFIDSMPEARLALDLFLLSEKWNDEKNLKENLEQDFPPRWRSHILAILLNSKTIQITKLVLDRLKKMCQMDHGLCFPVLSIVLYKLSKETNPHLQLLFLRMVPLMAIDKANISLVIGTYVSLSNNVSIPLRLNFLFSLFCTQRRTFPYLYRLLHDAAFNKNWESQLACSVIVLKLSQQFPDPYGQQCLAFIGELLKNNLGADGTEVLALALFSIYELCKAKVVIVDQTWKILESLVENEKRPKVTEAVCKILGEYSECESETDRVTAITRLWTFAESGSDSAFLALGRFNLEDFRLKNLPKQFRENLIFPKSYIVKNDQLLPEDVLTYIPNECWIQILKKSNHVKAVEKMLSDLVKKEIAELPRGIYSLPLGAEEPSNLSQLPHKSILRGLIDTLQKIINNNWTKPELSTSILTILGEDFLRPIPPLNWSFLNPNPSDKISVKLVFKILSRQGPKSPSARKILQEFLSKIEIEKEIIVDFCENLSGISQCVAKTLLSSIVGDLLRITLDDVGLFKNVLGAVRKSVALADVSEANRLALANALKELLVDLPVEIEDVEELWESIAELPEAVTTRIASPLQWPEITSRRIRHALKVRRKSAVKSEQPLEFFIELIDAVCSRPEDQLLVQQQLALLFHQIDSKQGSASFRLLVTRLLAATNNPTENDEINFLFNLVSISVVVLSGHDFILTWDQLFGDKKLTILPGCVYQLFNNNAVWIGNLPFTVESFYRLKKSEKLNDDQKQAIHCALLSLKHHPYCLEPTRWPRLFYNN